MKYIKSYILFFLMVFAVTGCTTDDLKDDVNDLKDRVTLIEEQVKLLNDNLAVVAYILDTQNKTISEVKNVTDNGEVTQKKIVLSDGTELTLTIGKPGTINEPEVTVGEDKMWYINGEPTGVIAVGEPGKNGEGYPEFRVQDGNWQVRFGDGDWKPVTGGGSVAGSSLGDQFFVKAEVVGDNFVVTMTDGTVHTLPIVADLACAIDKTSIDLDAEGFWVIEKDTRVEVLVKITGENPQVTYPQGWRATLSELDAADDKGNNYKLYIYAPAATVKAVNTRAAANNTSDITVQVQKGSLWAVDKIKVKTPKELNTNEERYNDGQKIRVGGLEITRELYGDVKAVPADGKLTEGGVYFISENGKELTCGLPITGVENLIILPNTEDITVIKLTVTKQVYLKGTFVCQNVTLSNQIEDFHYPLRVMGETGVNIVMDHCKIKNLVATKGFAMKGASKESIVTLDNFIITNSDIEIAVGGSGFYLMTQMGSKNVSVENNLIYNSSETDLLEAKICNSNSLTIENLNLASNTLIDIESSGTSTYGLIRGNVTNATVKDNFYWLSNAKKGSFFFSGSTSTVTNLAASNNYGYSNSGKQLRMFQNTASTPDIELVADLFATFDKSTGTFIPKDEYKAYGAQR